ncbi:DUF6074 family protein [Mesorhizobium silamurunense]|uniref:DUF6074 family protein n=1 Tax=Mesorhizobium silamurunense TaxID=499528 RepID=UPI001FEDFC59|nr:DUF6074 family protein [Mesorhizobium silamurunense]
MCSDQLDLLTWRPRFRLVVFPLSANVGKVRRCAEVLERKHGRNADAYWKRVIGPMVERLSTAGVALDVIQSEIDAFSMAVQLEIQRRAWLGHNRPGGSAA